MRQKLLWLPLLSLLALMGCDNQEKAKPASSPVIENNDRVASETDKMLLVPVRRAVNNTPGLKNADTVNIEVKEGSILLTGALPSQEAKVLLMENVKAVNGVKSVEDQIEIRE